MPKIRAMILGAGRGKRMRPLSDLTPKPLLKYHGKRMVDWQIEGLMKAGIRSFIINTAHLSEQFPATLGNGSDRGISIQYSEEGLKDSDALETLGGIAKALPLLSPDRKTPFVVVAGDIVTQFDYSRLTAHAEDLLEGHHDAHLVLVPNPDFHPDGDMTLENGLVRRTPRQWTFSSIGIYSPRIFEGIPPLPAKLFPWLYSFCDTGRITGELYYGAWANIGTPEQLHE